MLRPYNCRHCNATNPETARYCTKCGADLAATGDEGVTLVAPPSPTSEHCTPEVVQELAQRLERTMPHGIPVTACALDSVPYVGQREATVFVPDRSKSMNERYDANRTKIIAAIMATIQMITTKAAIDEDDEIALVAFNSHARVMMPLHPIRTHKQHFIRELQSLTPDNGTNINEGLKAARGVFDWSRSDIVRRIVLLTDGKGGDPLRTAQDLKDRGVVIDVVGIGPDPSSVNEKLLRSVASTVEGELRYQFIQDFGTLVTHYENMGHKTHVRP